MRLGLCKSEPTNTAKLLRQLIFGNPLITNAESKPLGLSSRSEGNTLASAGCTRIRDFWDPELQEWKGLSALGVNFHPANRQNKDLIIASIPWNPATSNSRSHVGDWVSKRGAHKNVSPEWVYQITEVTQTTASAREFKKSSPAGRIQATSTQNISIPLEGYEPVRVFAQDGHGATLELAKDLLLPGKKPPIYWTFETGFISDLSWDPEDWHWQKAQNMRDAPFFGYSAKRGYQNARKIQHTPNITSFIQRLNLRNSTVAQIITRMWHNARPRKVGALTWLTFNNGLPVGTWLQMMGIHAPCKGCEQGLPESAQHCLMDYLPAQLAWKAFFLVWEEWEVPNHLAITWPFMLLSETVFEEDDDPPDLHCYHTGGFSYRRQPLDILRSFLLFYLWSERCRRHFDNQYSLKRVLFQAWEATAEVDMAS